MDALEPAVLVDLVRREVEGERDDGLWDEAVEREEIERELLERCHSRWDEVRNFLAPTPGVQS